MRTIVVTLGLSLLLPVASAAQAPEKVSVTPAPQYRPTVDFGLDQALKKLPEGPWRVVKPTPKHALLMQPSLPAQLATPIDCEMVKTHRHEPLSPGMRTIKPSPSVHHHLLVVPVPPCPIR